MNKGRAASDQALLERLYHLCSSNHSPIHHQLGNVTGTFYELADSIGYTQLIHLLRFGHPRWLDNHGELECSNVSFWLVDAQSNKVASVEGIIKAVERLWLARQKWRWAMPPGARMHARRRKGRNPARMAWIKSQTTVKGDPPLRNSYSSRMKVADMRSSGRTIQKSWKRHRRQQWKT